MKWHESPELVDVLNRSVAEIESRSMVDVSKWEKAESAEKSNLHGAAPSFGGKGKVYSPLGEFLYGLENLRKKPIEVQTEMEEEQEEEEGEDGIVAREANLLA